MSSQKQREDNKRHKGKECDVSTAIISFKATAISPGPKQRMSAQSWENLLHIYMWKLFDVKVFTMANGKLDTVDPDP